LVAISRNAFDAAWISEGQRVRFLKRLEIFARQNNLEHGFERS
jgi:adenosine deaminase